jgi:hypothetical protein
MWKSQPITGNVGLVELATSIVRPEGNWLANPGPYVVARLSATIHWAARSLLRRRVPEGL